MTFDKKNKKNPKKKSYNYEKKVLTLKYNNSISTKRTTISQLKSLNTKKKKRHVMEI